MLRFTDHARRRMVQRGITEGDVSRVVNLRSQVSPGDNGAVIYGGYTEAARFLNVCCLFVDGDTVIKSAWFK